MIENIFFIFTNMKHDSLVINEKIDLDIPNGISGRWEIKEFTITEVEARINNASGNSKGREIVPGTYKALMCKIGENAYLRHKITVMSKTPAEVSDHMPFIRIATGNVLICGLGLGMVVQALIDKPEVISITIIENSHDVVKLAGDDYQKNSSKVSVQKADALKYYSSVKYDAIWFDIWDSICTDNISEMDLLK